MDVYALDDQRDVLVTDDAVIADGRELSGAEVGALLAQLDRVRLATLWREMNRFYPLGSWVRCARSKRETPDQVIGYHRGAPGSVGHMIEIRTGRGEHLRVPVAEAEVARAPQGER